MGPNVIKTKQNEGQTQATREKLKFLHYTSMQGVCNQFEKDQRNVQICYGMNTIKKTTKIKYLKGKQQERGRVRKLYITQQCNTHEICGKYKHRKHIKPERHIYTWFTQFGLRPHRTAGPSFLLSSKMKRHNLQQILCNICCSLSQSPYLFLALRIHIQYTAAIQYPHTK